MNDPYAVCCTIYAWKIGKSAGTGTRAGKGCRTVSGSGTFQNAATNERLAQAGCSEVARKYKSLRFL